MRCWASLLLFLTALTQAACREGVGSPNLLNAVDFAPDDAEVGDRLELIGTGFPEGKPATLTFRGSLHRPGREAIDAVEIVALANSTSQHRISLVLTEQLQAEFVGIGPEAAHTTFHGDVVGSFSPRSRGAPPVTGVVRDVVLDLPAVSAVTRDLASSVAEGKRLLEFAGVEPDASRQDRIVVGALRAHGRGERAGLAPGDELLEFDGVRVRSIDDLLPSGKHRIATVLVRHGRLKEPVERSLDVDGFRATAPSELGVAAMLIGLAAALVLLFAAPFARVITWAERRVSNQLKLKLAANESRTLLTKRLVLGVARALGQSLPASAAERPLARLMLYFSFVGSSAVLTWLAFGRTLVLPELDLVLLVVLVVTLLVATGLMLGGFGERRGWSLVLGLKHAVFVTSCQIPALVALACALLMTGSLRVQDTVLSQGAAPWQWSVFKNPTLLVMFFLFLASAVPEASRAGAEFPELDTGETRSLRESHPHARSVTSFAEWTNLLVLSGIASIVFLGGFRLPFVGAVEQQATFVYQVLGALLLLGKCWALVLLVMSVRWTLPDVRVQEVVSFWWRWLIPLSLAGIVLSFFWLYGLRSPMLRDIQSGLGLVFFALASFVFGYFVQRVAHNIRRTSLNITVNPWL